MIGELGRHRLSDNHSARRPQPRNRAGVPRWPIALAQRRTAFGRIILGVEYVLDRYRNAVQRTERLAFAPAFVERARLRARIIGIEMDEGVNRVLARSNPVEAGTDVFFRR